MISEGSCDTGVMAAENSALLHMNKFHFMIYIQVENSYFKLCFFINYINLLYF